MLLAGHSRLAAAKLLGLKEVPVVVVPGLSDAKKRAYRLADNKLAEQAGWDREILALELPELQGLLELESLELSLTGFAPPEVDGILSDHEEHAADPADAVPSTSSDQRPISRPGDLWLLSKHRLLCGDVRSPEDLARLMDGQKATLAFLDPPYNVRVASIVGRGRTKHQEFAVASGELTKEGFTAFLMEALTACASVSQIGAVHFVCMDWRHLGELLAAGEVAYGALLNLAVWAKSNAGQGSFYRSQHELIFVFRVGDAPHVNNVELGRYGRSRSNVWRYAGVNTFRTGPTDELTVHPTVKPVAMVADAIKDCTTRGAVVLDSFCGSGTTILAAERVGRVGYGLEIEPRYIDAAVRRWQAFTGKDAVHGEPGETFNEHERALRTAKHVSVKPSPRKCGLPKSASSSISARAKRPRASA
ncbi:DNA modification methylase [Chthonobacter rhizosphaerae]|uniref:DNA modification methylase n=1 Tax=Chthonobacter rhizosphaerae TaxID=2735553 RepID=UPI0031B59A4B